MYVQTFLIKKQWFFFMVDLAPYYFHLSELLYYFKKNFDYTIMIKENYWYANYLNHSRTEAKYLSDVLFVLIVCENSIETSLYLPLIKYVRDSHIG